MLKWKYGNSTGSCKNSCLPFFDRLHAIGWLGDEPREIISTLKDSGLTLKALLANLVLVPIVGWILLHFIPLPPAMHTGLLLLSIAPGGLFALNFARVSKANVHLAVALLILLSLVGIIVTPALAHFVFGGKAGTGYVLHMILLLFLLLVAPIVAGKLIANYISPAVAQKLARWIGTLSIVLFVVLTLLTSKAKSQDVKLIGTGGILFIVLLVIISWVLGWLLGGTEMRNKVVMAISMSLRNVGICLPIAIHEFAGSNVVIPILAFSGVSIPMNFLFALAAKFLLRKKTDFGLHEDPIAPKT